MNQNDLRIMLSDIISSGLSAVAISNVTGISKIDLSRFKNGQINLIDADADKLNKFQSIKNNFIGKSIVSLSVCSYGMYFSHVIVTKFLSYYNPHSHLMFPVMFIIIVFLSWLLPYIVSKIPHLKRFSGA